MAAQDIVFGGPPDETLTIKVWAPGAAFDAAPTHDAVATTRDAEAAARYKASITGTLAGRCYIEILAGADVVGYSHVTLANANGTYVAENLAALSAQDVAIDADGFTLAEILRLLAAAILGKSNRAGSTVVYRAADDSKARIIATTDATGRTSVTLDAD